MKVILGYGIKYETETLEEAARAYFDGSAVFGTKVRAMDFIEGARKNGNIKKKEKTIIFRIIAEEVQ